MHRDYRNLLETCESLIRAGKANEAAEKLAALNTARVPRAFRLALANLCRRTDLLNQGLRILETVARPDMPVISEPASEAELCEYAMLLARSDARHEAMSILDRLDPKRAPAVHMVRASFEVTDWNYAGALSSLEAFLASSTEEYPRLVGRVNLAAALIALGRLDEAMAHLAPATEYASRSGFARLHANCFELSAQVHVARRDFSAARTDLSQADAILRANGTRDELFVRKWTALVLSLEDGTTERLDRFRDDALEMKNWESIRDADRLALQVRFDEARFDRLYFGTPLERYRADLSERFSRVPAAETFLLGSESQPRLDVKSGEISGLGQPLKARNIPLRLLQILFKDLYRPLRIGGLFSSLFPGEHFDIFSSPTRVHQTVYRTRRYLEENGVPISIEENDGRYSARVHDGFSIAVPLEGKPLDNHSLKYTRLQARFQPGHIFSSAEAKEALGLSGPTFTRFIAWAMDQGLALKRGAGPATRYELTARAAA